MKNGVKFVGSFRDDVPHGIVTKHYPDGSYEILEFKKGEVEGIKVMRHINGYGHIEENYSEKDFILKSIEGQVENNFVKLKKAEVPFPVYSFNSPHSEKDFYSKRFILGEDSETMKGILFIQEKGKSQMQAS